MILGGILGLAGTISTFFPFSVMGVLSFALVIVFGVVVVRRRPEAPLAVATVLWFASLGAVACVALLWVNRSGWVHSDLWDAQAFFGLLGTGLALAGAFLKRRGRKVNPPVMPRVREA